MGYVSKRIIKDIHAYCVDVDPVKVQEALAQERAEEEIEQLKIKKRRQWEESEYRKLYLEMMGDTDDYVADTSKKVEDKPEDDDVFTATHKFCPGCGKTKSLLRFRKGIDGDKQPYCIDCQVRSEREMRKAYKRSVVNGVKQYKHCVRCGLAKEINHFAHSVKSPDGYRRTCKECIRASRRKK